MAYPGVEGGAPPQKCCFTLHSESSSSIGDSELSHARIGSLAIPLRSVLETPTFLGLTSRGVVPHLTPDVLLEHTDLAGVHLALEDYIERATSGIPPVMNAPSRRSTPLHTFTALPPSYVTLMAPRRTPAVSAPNGNTNNFMSIFTSVGFQTLSTSQYSTYFQTLRPDIAVALGDVSYGTYPGVKRVAKMADRTSKWVDEFITHIKSSPNTSETAIFAPILSTDAQSQSEYFDHLADDIAESISGLAFYSSSLLPDIPATSAISTLPRLSLDEPQSPQHILREISLGMDLFTVPFVGFATDEGLTLTFRFPTPSPTTVVEDEQQSRIHPLAIDLLLSSHASSVAPLQPDCSCYTCTCHHRAYVQHLLSAKEMLGWVLLQIHNHQVLSSFFASVRASIKAGTFESDRQNFEAAYDSDLPVGTGQKPRARGYHFRSEGPGEKKRNKPAWGALGGSNGDSSETGASGVNGDSKEWEE